MADTIIFPLSDDTGQAILAQLVRIANALESMGQIGNTATYDGENLVVTGATVDESGVLVTTATVDANGYLTF